MADRARVRRRSREPIACLRQPQACLLDDPCVAARNESSPRHAQTGSIKADDPPHAALRRADRLGEKALEVPDLRLILEQNVADRRDPRLRLGAAAGVGAERDGEIDVVLR